MQVSHQKFFRARGEKFVELGHFNKDEKFNLKIDTIRAFLPKNRTLFSIFQKGGVDGGGGGLLSPP